jgi:hypothetical protein
MTRAESTLSSSPVSSSSAHSPSPLLLPSDFTITLEKCDGPAGEACGNIQLRARDCIVHQGNLYLFAPLFGGFDHLPTHISLVQHKINITVTTKCDVDVMYFPGSFIAVEGRSEMTSELHWGAVADTHLQHAGGLITPCKAGTIAVDIASADVHCISIRGRTTGDEQMCGDLETRPFQVTCVIYRPPEARRRDPLLRELLMSNDVLIEWAQAIFEHLSLAQRALNDSSNTQQHETLTWDNKLQCKLLLFPENEHGDESLHASHGADSWAVKLLSPSTQLRTPGTAPHSGSYQAGLQHHMIASPAILALPAPVAPMPFHALTSPLPLGAMLSSPPIGSANTAFQHVAIASPYLPALPVAAGISSSLHPMLLHQDRTDAAQHVMTADSAHAHTDMIHSVPQSFAAAHTNTALVADPYVAAAARAAAQPAANTMNMQPAAESAAAATAGGGTTASIPAAAAEVAVFLTFVRSFKHLLECEEHRKLQSSSFLEEVSRALLENMMNIQTVQVQLNELVSMQNQQRRMDADRTSLSRENWEVFREWKDFVMACGGTQVLDSLLVHLLHPTQQRALALVNWAATTPNSIIKPIRQLDLMMQSFSEPDRVTIINAMVACKLWPSPTVIIVTSRRINSRQPRRLESSAARAGVKRRHEETLSQPSVGVVPLASPVPSTYAAPAASASHASQSAQMVLETHRLQRSGVHPPASTPRSRRATTAAASSRSRSESRRNSSEAVVDEEVAAAASLTAATPVARDITPRLVTASTVFHSKVWTLVLSWCVLDLASCHLQSCSMVVNFQPGKCFTVWLNGIGAVHEHLPVDIPEHEELSRGRSIEIDDISKLCALLHGVMTFVHSICHPATYSIKIYPAGMEVDETLPCSLANIVVI